MTNIIPIRDLKDTSKISEMCHESDEPIFITKNGYQDMVIMSADVYDQLRGKAKGLHKRETVYNRSESKEWTVAETTTVDSFLALPVYSVEEIKEILKPIFEKFKVKNAVLFGSYAKGCATKKSDIDLFVNSGLKGLKFYGLLEEVSNSFSCAVDLIDSQDVEKGSEIEKEIKKTGIKIYER